MTRPISLAENKLALRRAMRERRAQIGVVQRIAAAKAVMAIDLDRLALPGTAVIGGYYPVRDEIDPLPLLARLHREGFALAMPYIRDDARLGFRPWYPDAPMTAGQYGIPVPATHETVEPDAVIVPLLGFDASGARLGYGGGHYDRTLRHLRSRGTVVAVGLAFDEQRLDTVFAEPHDEPLDWIATPAGLHRCARRG
jgi:5-formyltetrahydrofolate cyclo-ligase